MKNFAAYLTTVLIWGSTWMGIKMQLGIVDPMVSVAYRFALASIILLIFCSLQKMRLRFSLAEHGYMALQGILLFGINYFLFYKAELFITSGLAAVIFSSILLMNIVNSAIFLGARVDSKVVLGGSLGLFGIILVFFPEISSFSLDNRGVQGLLYCLLATLLASFGNITSARNQKNQLPIIQTNGFGMGYGALLMLLVSLGSGKPLMLELSFAYLGSLFYLAIFGSIIAFGCYLSLIGSIGADRAAYATLLFPLVALTISTIWEGYTWNIQAMVGVFFIVFGNTFILVRRQGATRKADTAKFGEKLSTTNA